LPPVGDGGIDVSGLDVSEADLHELLSVDPAGWKHQIPQIHAHYAKFGRTLPAKLHEQLAGLEQRLS
jgi:phosphoenolpyruvate carboxykinase (GTP)